MPSPLLTFSTETNDPAQVSHASPGWQQEHIVTQAGSYRFRALAVQTARVQLGQTQVSLGRIVRGAIPSGALTFAVPVWALGEIRCRGKVLDALAVATESHEAEIDVRYEGMTKQIVLSVDEAFLLDRATHLWQRDPSIHDLTFPSANDRHAFLSVALAELAARKRETHRPAEAFERRIVDHLLVHTAPQEDSASGARRRRVALEARQYIHDHLTEPISLGEMSRATRASYRTLQYAFLETFGESPAEYARRQRMLHARRALELDDVTSVTEAAIRYGFDHLGRFAGAYANMFGEKPSETLQAARKGAAHFG